MVDRLTPRAAAAIGAVAFLLVLLVGWFLFVSPKRSKASDLATEIDASRAQLAVAQALLRGSEARTENLEQLAQAMPPDIRMSGILRELSTASATANVRINSVTPQPATPLGSYQTIPLSVTLEGRYFNVVRFLSVLHNRANVVSVSKVTGKGRLYNVPQLQLTGGAETGVLQATLTVDAYSFTGVAATPVPTTDTTATTSDTSTASEPAQTP